jgi:hypothetical protein
MGFWQLPESGKVSKAQVVRYPTLDAYRLHHSSPSLHELYQSEVLRFEASVRKPTRCPQTAFSRCVQHAGVILLGALSLVSGVSLRVASCLIVGGFARSYVNALMMRDTCLCSIGHGQRPSSEVLLARSSEAIFCTPFHAMAAGQARARPSNEIGA